MHKSIKLLSFFLALLLLAELVPMQVWAAAAADEPVAIAETTDASAEAADSSAEILGEDESLRSADTKHFYRADGSYMAVKYATPVHYQTSADAPWKDIDNSLVLTDEKELVDKELLARADTYASANGRQVYVPQSSPLDVVLSKTTDSAYLASMTNGKNTLSWRYAAVSADLKSARAAADAEILYSASAQPLSLGEAADGTDNAQTKAVCKVTEGLVYPHIAPNVDLEVILDAVYLKENLVLKSADAANAFRLTYAIGEMEAKQVSSQEIALLDESGETAFTVCAPYMEDAAMACSQDLSLEIQSVENGEMAVLLTADKQWLQDADRSYPVKIDPYVFQGTTNPNQDATAMYQKTDSYPNGTLVLGNDKGNDYGKTRTYIKFDLPTLAAGDVVVGSAVHIRQYTDGYGYSHVDNSSLQINAYQVTGSWTENDIIQSVSFSGLPTRNMTVVDFQTVSESTRGNWAAFDVTALAKKWYEGSANYGVCLEAADTDAYAIARFVSTDNTDYPGYRPTLEVSYLNAKGLEGRWTTHAQSLGRSGSSYINDHTGNLVFAAPVAATTGGRMPVSISLIYNGFQHGKVVDRPYTVGKGWRLSIQEKLTPISSGGSGLQAALYNSGYRFKYEDSDGTAHYFKLKSGSSSVYEDEEGMGLTLTVKGTVENYVKYVITSDADEQLSFTANGNLLRITDSDNNFIKIDYFSDGRVDRVKDGDNRQIVFTYTTGPDGKKEDRLLSVKDPSGRITKFGYSEYGSLISINFPDGKRTTFGFDNNYKMTAAVGTDGSRLEYTYAATKKAAADNRVVSVFQKNRTETAEGTRLTMDYSGMNRTVFTDNKGRSETYQFDNSGRTVSIRSSTGYMRTYSYVSGSEENNKTANALKSVGGGEKFVRNMLRDPSFERGGSWSLSAASYATDAHYLGTRSVKLTGSGAYASQTRTVLSGYTYYSFSAYVKTGGDNADAAVSMKFLDASGNTLSTVKSNPIDYTTDWQRISISGKIPDGTAKIRVRCTTGGAGTAWFDCAQLEKGVCVNAYNLAENGSFDDSGNSSVWSASGASGSDGLTWSDSDGFYKFTGGPDAAKRVKQSIPINRVGNKTFLTVSAQAKGSSVPLESGRHFGIGVVAHYTDGTTGSTRWIKFNPHYSAGWQYTSGTVGFDTPKTIASVDVFCAYEKNANSVLFDCVQVNLDETGVSYTYDAKGNMISAKDNAGRNQTFTYSSVNEITEAKTADNKKYKFTYDTSNKHRLVSATSATDSSTTTPKVTFSFGYDDYGNLTTSRVESSKKYIQQYTKYDSKGSFVTRSMDDWGHYTKYAYNSTKGTLSSVEGPTGGVTKYTYNANSDRLEKVAAYNSTSDSSAASTVSYAYSKEDLASVTTPSTKYAFTYDTFGNPLKTTAGGKTLVQNTYEKNNGNLTGSEYGNGLKVGYEYDDLDRLAGKSYNGEKKAEWTYNAAGQLGRHWDFVSNRYYTYSYDALGRLTRTDCSDGNWLQYGYNTIDQSTKLRYHYNGVTRTTSYTYTSPDNLPASASFFSIGKVSTAYDGLTRPYQTTYKTGSDYSDATAAYSYVNWTSDENRTTSLVRGIDYTHTSGLLDVSDLYYTYDEARNITSERVWTTDDTKPLREKYTYDKKNQLTRHDSKTQNATFVYTYDSAGNIKSVKRYAFTTGALPSSALETRSYVYDSSWGDLLTKYNGKTIGHDAIGNMTSYNGSTYTWQGRELRKITSGSNTYSYKYNADGIRTSKTVNGTKTEFFLNGSQILAQKTGDTTMLFFYDSAGKRVGFANGDTLYYYLYNVQGDVIAIVRAATGQIVAKYSYDAWGKCTVTNASGYTVGEKNPFRYRGYYYDTETGLYYLNSRYYSPEFGRFISADGQLNDDILGNNMYAYCGNNPINREDSDGKGWVFACSVVGFIAGGLTKIITNVAGGKKWNDGVIGAAVGGAVYGGVLATTGSVLAAGYAGAAAESLTNQVLSYVPRASQINGQASTKKVTTENIVNSVASVIDDTAINGAISAATGAFAGKAVPTNNGWFKPKKLTSCFFGKYARKSELQTVLQSSLQIITEGFKSEFMDHRTMQLPVVPIFSTMGSVQGGQ